MIVDLYFFNLHNCLHFVKNVLKCYFYFVCSNNPIILHNYLLYLCAVETGGYVCRTADVLDMTLLM